jgi:hypothetical protein
MIAMFFHLTIIYCQRMKEPVCLTYILHLQSQDKKLALSKKLLI